MNLQMLIGIAAMFPGGLAGILLSIAALIVAGGLASVAVIVVVEG